MHGKIQSKGSHLIMKRLFTLFLAMILSGSAVACQKASYSDIPTSEELSRVAIDALQNESGYVAADKDSWNDYFQTPDFVRDHSVYFCSDRNDLDEIGVFHVTEGHAKEMQSLLREYLNKSLTDNRAWYDSYIPQETPKLRDAEVRIFGNYVVYAILSTPNREHFFQSIDTFLQK